MRDWHDHSFDEVFVRLNLKQYQIPRSAYASVGKVPVVDQGKELIAGYAEGRDPVLDVPVIIFGDHTRIVKWIDFPFVVGADGTQPLRTTDICDLHFGYFVLSNTRIRDLGYSRHFSELREASFFLPDSLSEQRAVARILGDLERAVDLIGKLCAANVERKRGLAQQLLTGEKRFKDHNTASWRTVRIGSLLEECDRYVDWSNDQAYRFASIRRRSGGLFDRGTFYGREVKTKVLKLLKAGDFVISKRQVVHGAWAMVTKPFDGFGVSDEYDVLVNHDPRTLDMRFFNYLSQTRRLWHMAYLASNGVHIEKLIFDYDDFAKEKVRIPPTVEEQAKIVDVLCACDHEIELLKKQLEALKEQKRGLMQKLLTGEVRVKV